MKPGSYDVLCCKSSEAYEHIGNRRFRSLVQSHSSIYAKVTHSKILKSQVVNDIIRAIRSSGGNFLQQSKGCQGKGAWTTIKKNRTREKVGHALRRAVEKERKSSRSSCTTMTTPKPQVRPQHFTYKPAISEQFGNFVDYGSKTAGLSTPEFIMDPCKPINCFPTAEPVRIQSNDSCSNFATLIDRALFDPFESTESLGPLLATQLDDEPLELLAINLELEPLLITESNDERDSELDSLLKDLIEK